MHRHRGGYESATSWVLDSVGYNFIVHRSSVYPPELEEIVDEKKRRRVLGAVRYVIQVLRKKNMVFLIPKRFIINIPLVLTYYRIKDGNLAIVAEALRSGGRLDATEARATIERIISDYYDYFNSFINELFKFYQTYRRVVLALNEYGVIYKLEEKLYEYLPFILIESRSRGKIEDEGKVSRRRRTLEFLRVMVKTIELAVGSETIEKLYHRWRVIEEKLMLYPSTTTHI